MNQKTLNLTFRSSDASKEETKKTLEITFRSSDSSKETETWTKIPNYKC